METPEPTSRPRGGARIDRSRRKDRGRIAVVAVGAVVVLSLMVTGVAQLKSNGVLDSGQAAEPVARQAGARAIVPTPPPDAQGIVPAAELELQDQPAGEKAKGAAKGAGKGGSDSLVTRAERIAQGLPVTPAEPFGIASFNMLGASHTNGKGRRAHFANGATRAGQAASLISSLGIDVVGAQEFEPVQQSVFLSRLPSWSVFPGQTLSVIDGTNSIAWNSSLFELVQAETIAIPYFGGRTVQMPYVLLEQRSSGQRFWVANFHNPADVHGAAQHWRVQATNLEAELAAQLHNTGVPVLMTGDFNEHAEFYCRISSITPVLKSASGALPGPPCYVPPGPRVDWVLGSTPVAFSNYRELDGGPIEAITDHPVIVADVSMQ
ncbi:MULTISPECIES: endonuclease/exonuclease/phosphatase family protein [unclassified Nocardioides]|uniref:endonuclease/exonuclease/phosphatase family protein n=1 Tax=unclassified Nocardioides TaxID=2615069 RepID=UPI00361F9E58